MNHTLGSAITSFGGSRRIYDVIIQYLTGYQLLSSVGKKTSYLAFKTFLQEGKILKDREGIMSAGEYCCSIPTGRSISVGGTSTQSKPCQSLMDLATLFNSRRRVSLFIGAQRTLEVLAA